MTTEDEMAAEYARVILLTVPEIRDWCASHDWRAYRRAYGMTIVLAWCDKCQHTHRVDGACMLECVDCEHDLVTETETYLEDNQ